VVGNILLSCLLACTAAESTYVVKRGDTLTSIARSNCVTLGLLAERNGLTKNHHVTTGQRLTIPGNEKPSRVPEPVTPQTAPPTTATGLPRSVNEGLNNAPVRTGRWKYIVIHHSAVDEGTVKAMDEYHRTQRHMEHGLAYHFVIGNGNGMRDGEIAVGNRWTHQLDGGHLRSEEQNKIALGICLVGNFDEHAPSARQLQSLEALVRALMKRCNVPASRVKTHQQINVIGTRCPGTKFPARSFLNGLKTAKGE